MDFNRVKFDHIDKDATCILKKSRKDGEGPMFEIEKSVEKIKLRALLCCWKVITYKRMENICRRHCEETSEHG